MECLEGEKQGVNLGQRVCCRQQEASRLAILLYSGIFLHVNIVHLEDTSLKVETELCVQLELRLTLLV